jgi:hypothetical protein
MTRNELQALVGKMSCKRIVTEQRGSWQWQDAFRVATYRATLADNGAVVWRSAWRSRKYSAPQMGRAGIDYPMYSMHNVGVTRSEAVATLGACLVKDIERRGWRFA